MVNKRPKDDVSDDELENKIMPNKCSHVFQRNYPYISRSRCEGQWHQNRPGNGKLAFIKGLTPVYKCDLCHHTLCYWCCIVLNKHKELSPVHLIKVYSPLYYALGDKLIEKGHIVRIRGVKSQKQLQYNGMKGVVEKFLDKQKRWGVKLEDNNQNIKRLSLKSIHLVYYADDNDITIGITDEQLKPCLSYLRDVWNNYFNENICKFIYIHGGTLRDLINKKPVKDIDLTVDLHKIHYHAIDAKKECQNKNCQILNNFIKNKNVYQSFTKNANDPYKVASAFIESNTIINTRFLINLINNDKSANKPVKQISGPHRRANHLQTWKILFNNDIDFDIMDNCAFYLVKNKSYLSNILNIPGVYPFEHKILLRGTDSISNTLHMSFDKTFDKNDNYIPMKQWNEDYFIDSLSANTNQDEVKNQDWEGGCAINDLRAGYVRMYTMWSGDENEDQLGDLIKSNPSMAEFYIYRTMKNAQKMINVSNVEYASIDYRLQILLMDALCIRFGIIYKQDIKYKKLHFDETTLKDILRHAFNHSFYAKITEDTIVSFFHLIGMDALFVYLYLKNDHFKKELDLAINNPAYKKHIKPSSLWLKMQENGNYITRHGYANHLFHFEQYDDKSDWLPISHGRLRIIDFSMNSFALAEKFFHKELANKYGKVDENINFHLYQEEYFGCLGNNMYQF